MRTLILCTLLLLAFGCQSAPQYDVLITGGTLIDGTGAAPRDADVAIKDGVIVEVGDLSGANAALVIEADGRVVTPGFIDLMGVSSLPLLLDPVTADSKL